MKGFDFMNRRNMNKRFNRKIKESRFLKEAEIGDIVSFNELNDAQKEYVVNHAGEWRQLDWIWEFYNEGLMDWYQERKDEIVNKYNEKYGFDINGDKIYWQSNSQGPYPEWRLDEIFDAVYVNDANDSEATIEFSGKSTDPDRNYSIDLYYYDMDEYEDWVHDYGLDIDDLRNPEYHLDESFIADISNIIEGAQAFIDEIWGLINEVCTSYPDDDYIYQELEYDDGTGDFEVINDTEAKPYYDTMSW